MPESELVPLRLIATKATVFSNKAEVADRAVMIWVASAGGEGTLIVGEEGTRRESIRPTDGTRVVATKLRAGDFIRVEPAEAGSMAIRVMQTE